MRCGEMHFMVVRGLGCSDARGIRSGPVGAGAFLCYHGWWSRVSAGTVRETMRDKDSIMGYDNLRRSIATPMQLGSPSQAGNRKVREDTRDLEKRTKLSTAPMVKRRLIGTGPS